MKLSDITKINKAIYAFLVSGITLSTLLGLDIDLNTPQVVAITATLTAIAVWVVPNVR